MLALIKYIADEDKLDKILDNQQVIKMRRQKRECICALKSLKTQTAING